MGTPFASTYNCMNRGRFNKLAMLGRVAAEEFD